MTATDCCWSSVTTYNT